MRTRHLLSVAIAGVAVVATACGNDDDSAASTTAGTGTIRTVEVEMRDIAFAPTQLAVKKGETIRFVFTNKGAAVHDAFIGDKAAQDDHEKEMQAAMSSGSMDMGHGGHADDEPAITVNPGKTEELTHTFDVATSVEIGCHQPGHYGAGMKIDVSVV